VLSFAPDVLRSGRSQRPGLPRRAGLQLKALSAPALLPEGCPHRQRRVPALQQRRSHALVVHSTVGDDDGSRQLIRDADGHVSGLTEPVTVDKLVALCVSLRARVQDTSMGAPVPRLDACRSTSVLLTPPMCAHRCLGCHGAASPHGWSSFLWRTRCETSRA
jgi:hypothetical protein